MFAVGFPPAPHQAITVDSSLRTQFVGLQLKSSWPAAGPYIAGQLHAYAPHIVAGVSYSISVVLSDAQSSRTERNSDEEGAVNQPTASCPEPRPDSSLLREAVEDTVNSWLRSAQATYGSVYTDLSYSYSISGTSISSNNASVTVRYSGSVTEILTGQRHSASGTVSATFRWNGCGWGVARWSTELYTS